MMDPLAKFGTTSTGSGAGASSSAVGRFPNAFNVYQTKTRPSTSTFVLGEHQDQPLYAATFHVGWSGRSDATLHDGPNVESPALATAKTERLTSLNSIINIPSPPAGDAVSESLRVEYHLTGESHHFAVITGTGPNVFPEKFEWRQSRGEEVKGGDTSAYGWKLVRLGSDKNGTAGDGKEVVAALVDTQKLSTKVAKFRFLNSGATGELGDIWSIMAVVSALRIWQMRWFLGGAA